MGAEFHSTFKSVTFDFIYFFTPASSRKYHPLHVAGARKLVHGRPVNELESGRQASVAAFVHYSKKTKCCG